MKGSRIRIVKKEPLAESELNSALALGEEEPIWLTIIQLLEQRKAECIENAASAIPVGANSVVSEICGWDHLDAFERDLFDRRQKGLNAK